MGIFIKRKNEYIILEFDKYGKCVTPLKKTDDVFFTCSLCNKETSKKVGTLRKNKQKITNNSLLFCGACSVKQTNLKKYGVENVSQIEEVKEKIKQTNLEKYGVENVSQIEEVKEKIKNGKNYILDEEKRKQTNLERYGVENVSQLEEVKDRKKETLLKNFGVLSPLSSSEILESVKQTNLKKYGVENVSQIEEVKDRKKEKVLKNSLKNIYERLENNELEFVDVDFYSGQRDSIKNENKEYLFKCKRCGKEFYDNLHSRIPRCLDCFPTYKSLIEEEMLTFMKDSGLNVISGDKTIIPPYELDIVVPDKKLAIETNGLYWHSEQMGKDKNYHLNKSIEANKKGYSLIHVFEDEWIFKKNIVKSIIRSKIGIFEKRIFARKCFIKEITNKEAESFFNVNHLQGYIPSSVNIGLFYREELVSCLSFSKPRYNKKYDWEITRFANSLNTSVVGGFSKLLKYFTKNYKGDIITYSDRRLFDGNVYRNNGFIELSPSEPNYFYFKGKKRFSRVKFQKHKLKDLLEDFDEELTEKENMENNGWKWVYDCGNWVFEYKGSK